MRAPNYTDTISVAVIVILLSLGPGLGCQLHFKKLFYFLKSNAKYLVILITKVKIDYLGRLLRLEWYRLPQLLMMGKIMGKQRVGRKKKNNSHKMLCKSYHRICGAVISSRNGGVLEICWLTFKTEEAPKKEEISSCTF